MYTLDEVREAFRKLEDRAAAQGADADYMWMIHGAADDVVRILAGELEEHAVEADSEEEETRDTCPACGQSLAGMGRHRFACPECYVHFGDEAVEAALAGPRSLAVAAGDAEAFDGAAFQILRGGFTSVEEVTAARESLLPGWKPSARTNAALLQALNSYGEKRSEARGRGAARGEAHLFAKREAQRVYNKVIGEN